MKISILNIGDEILIGQILNSNAKWLSEKISSIGADVIRHSVVKDEKNAIVNELDYLKNISDIILITGGLGPTKDDITKDTLADYFDSKIIRNNEIYNNLVTFFEERNKNISETNIKQADLPDKCKPIINKVGTAPGMMFEQNGKYFFSLPGVPSEMKYLTESFILDFIKNKMKQNNSRIMIYKTIRTFGIVESNLSDLIGDYSFLNGNSLAFLPSPMKGVRLRISVKSDNYNQGITEINRIKDELFRRIGKFIYGEDDENIIDKVIEMLINNNLTISVAESCTGGMLGAAFTDIPGSSEFFKGGMITYDNEIKSENLGISKYTIEHFGAVSEECANEMAKNIRLKFNSDIGLSITGIAGPSGGTAEKPVGTVWIGFSDKNNNFAKIYNFGQIRKMNRERSVASALGILYNQLVKKQ